MIFKDKRVDNLEQVVAQLVQVVNEQTLVIQELQGNNNRIVFKGFGHKD